MNLYTKLILASSLVLMTGCASVNHSETVKKLTDVSPNIVFAPAIDVPYSDVLSNNDTNLTVRWGGEVVQSSKVNDTHVRLTVAALPLNAQGLPIEAKKANQTVKYFAVDLNDSFSKSVKLDGHLVTLYGNVSEQKTISINNQNVSVPSITPLEIVDWDLLYQEKVAYILRKDPNYYRNVKQYSYSGHRFGHGFGHGFNSGFGHGFNSGFGRSFGGFKGGRGRH